MKKRLVMLSAFLLLLVGFVVQSMTAPVAIKASDHDDGETDVKTRNLNLTDVYMFREQDVNPTRVGAANNLIVAMNTNPRSVPRQQYFFSQKARYTMHFVADGTDRTQAPSASDSLQIQFSFNGQNAVAGTQNMSASVFSFANSGATLTNTQTFTNFGTITPCPPGIGTPVPVINAFTPTLNGAAQTIQVFAGLREDPFFFDVTQYFRVRAGLRGAGPAALPRAHAAAVDFTKDYNVNAIVMRIPIAALQVNGDTVFNAYATIESQ